MRRGQSRLGYGKTKEVVIKGHKAGLTMTEIAKKYGLSRPAVNNCAYRNGLKFPYVKMRQPYGLMKVLILDAVAAGKTRKEIVAMGVNRSTLNHYERAYNLNLKKR